MRHTYSPLRYPGGKGSIASCLADIILYNNLERGSYYEPYAGGAGAALYLLYNGFMDKIYLNDADYTIYAFWKSTLEHNEEFLNKITHAHLNIDEWYNQKDIIKSPEKHSLLDIGFATFFLNRCNRSGIINNAGPIGGYRQNGKWKIDARFNKVNLCQRIKKILHYKAKINISNLDAIDFLKQNLPKGNKRKEAFVYLDPPYFVNGEKLYMNYYNSSDHATLSRYIKKQKSISWVMTYDAADEIKELYDNIHEFSLNYSLQEKKKAQELMIVPDNVTLPKSNRIFANI